MNKLLPIALIVTPIFAGFTFATVSNAAIQGMAEGDMVGKTEVEITAALETLGAKIKEIESESDEIEIELMLNGVAYEVEVDLTTGLIAEVEIDDDDDENEEEDQDEDENDDS